jgi:hypothetical protein
MLLPNSNKAFVDQHKITDNRLPSEINDMTAIREHERVVLTTDMPEEKLTAGDVGVVVHIHDEGKAYEVEFVALDGETFAVVTLEHRHIRVVEQHEITHARRVA